MLLRPTRQLPYVGLFTSTATTSELLAFGVGFCGLHVTTCPQDWVFSVLYVYFHFDPQTCLLVISYKPRVVRYGIRGDGNCVYDPSSSLKPPPANRTMANNPSHNIVYPDFRFDFTVDRNQADYD